LSVDALVGEPTDQDRLLAQGFEEQLENLTSHSAIGFEIVDSMHLSERQLRRLVGDFYARYGINARSWRDVRNRMRVQTAVLLLSRPELTVAQVAREAGYASPNALARAFSKAGFPPPAIVRQRLSEKDPLP
jgi:transcriptional regulator GlxA family with amidase domain